MKALPVIPINDTKPSQITIQEAIRVNEILLVAPILKDDDKCVSALKLGIEALTFIQMSRVTTPGSVPTLLHGEADA